jgi:hypothetical protein
MQARQIKRNRIRASIVCQLLLLLASSGIVSGQSNQSSNAAPVIQADSLELPSFSIFGLSENIAGIDKPITAKELEKFMAELEKAKANPSRTRPANYYWIIPMVFYRARNLFAKNSWTVAEIKQGRDLSYFFAKLTGKEDLKIGKPEVKIEKLDQSSFRQGLVTLRNWFVVLCQDNRTLAAMVYTMNDGPFWGADVDAEGVAEMKVVESIPLPDQEARFILLRDRGPSEPMVFGIINADNSIRWLKRLSAAPKGRISSATFVQRTIYKLEGYGYICSLMVAWNGGMERGSVYLDDALNLRFYYLSW